MCNNQLSVYCTLKDQILKTYIFTRNKYCTNCMTLTNFPSL